MQERGRESGGRRNRSHSGRRRIGRSSSKHSKSKSKNYVELRDRAIQENKKKILKKIEKPTAQSRPKRASPVIQKRLEPIVKPKIHKSQRSLSKSSVIGAPKSPNLMAHSNEGDLQYLSFTIALCVAVGLLLVSSLDLLLSEGLLFIYLGFILIKKPSLYSRGRYFDWIALSVIAYGAGAFLFKMPFFYSDWRTSALESFGLNFGIFNSITPDISFEAWMRLVAATLLFYHMGHWKMNTLGRSRFFVYFVALAILLVFIDLGFGQTPFNFLIPKDSLFVPIKEYGNNLNLFLLIGSVVAWGVFFDSYLNKHKNLLASFCLVGLATIIVFFIKQKALLSLSISLFAAYALLIRMWIKRSSNFLSVSIAALPGLVFLLWLYLNPKIRHYLEAIIIEPYSVQFLALKNVASAQLGIFSFMGNGIATANSLLPQYTHHLYEAPLSIRNFDLLYFLNDFGLLGVSLLLMALLYWIWNYALSVRGSKKGLAFIPPLILLIFLVKFIYGMTSISVGLIILMLVFFDLSLRLKAKKGRSQAKRIEGKACQIVGVLFSLIGLSVLWISLFNLPMLSEVRYRLAMGTEINHQAVKNAILYRGFSPDPSYMETSDPNAHLFEAVQLIEVEEPLNKVMRSLERSAFLNPNLKDQSLEWGYLLQPYDLNQATDMWYAYFQEDPQGRFSSYKELLFYADTNYELLLKLNQLALLSQDYSLEYMKFLNKIDFQRFFQDFMEIDFIELDPDTRFKLMRRFLEYGMFEVFNHYQSQYQSLMDDFFILEAIREKEQANFKEALQILRSNIRSKSFDHFTAQADKKYIPRVFLQNNPDLEMGTILVQRAVASEAYLEALQYIDHLLTLEKPPLYLYYWRAELLFRTENLVDSWFAYMTYIDAAKVRHIFNPSHTHH